MITFNSVSKQYDDGTVAVQPMDLHIKQGEFFVLVGPSGCGKTTTLKMINRLIEPSNGTIEVNERIVQNMRPYELRRGIGYVLQQIALFPHMTVEQNIAITPELSGWERTRIDKRIDELLHMAGLDPSVFRTRKPSELSGGQQQRIGVLRALAADPPVVLMDEPFSALDPIARERLQNDLLALQATIRKTIVFVTHDIQEAIKLGDRIGLMRDGRMVQVDTPEMLMQRPADDFVREFFQAATPTMDTYIQAASIPPAIDATANDISGNAVAGQRTDDEGRRNK
ncbi:ABC transporter ATP-binding protein [Paenibacillus campi]|uniref:ABC transporter ATP-binding protein n=1 Tax=Paenibacillus campi TaxID=3106031 RepID=UPI002AFEBB82|nr:ABC transporter ATP-binding protein [Paenibacillus sp. SGZ-1009]